MPVLLDTDKSGLDFQATDYSVDSSSDEAVSELKNLKPNRQQQVLQVTNPY